MDKKILKQKVNTSDGGNSLKFQFKFRYFPENVADEVIQDVTLRLLFKQVLLIDVKIYLLQGVSDMWTSNFTNLTIFAFCTLT